MRTIIRATVLAVAALLVGSADAGAQIWGRNATPQNGVCFYENINYSGPYFCTNANANNPLVEMNDRISSIRVFGNAEVTVYQDRDFEGRSRTFASDMNDLRRDGWNDAISSVRVRPGAASADRWGRPAVPANGACFYEDTNFRGQSFCVPRGATYSALPRGFNDRISSVRVFGNGEVVLFQNDNFRGRSEVVRGDVRDLRGNWQDNVSSLRVF